MRSLNPPSYADVPNGAVPWPGSGRAGYIGAVSSPNPYLLRVAPDTALWQNQIEAYNADPRYGLVASVGTAGVNIGVPKTGTFVDMSEATRFHMGRFARSDPRAFYPLRPIIAGNASARINPALAWYSGGYTTALPSMSDQLSAMLNKPSIGGYSG